MSTVYAKNYPVQPSSSKKKRGAVFIVVVVSIVVHVLGLGVLGAMKIVKTISTAPEFKAPPAVVTVETPPPPPPPPTTQRTQRSMPRPQPLVAQNPQNITVPAIALKDSDLSIGSGRGLGGGFGDFGSGAMDAVRLTSFGFDRALEGTLEGTLYDFKQDERGKPIKRNWNFGSFKEVIDRFRPTLSEFTRSFNISELDRDFYKSENKLYASYFVIPFGKANIAPRSFGVEDEIKPSLLGAYYQGSYKPRESGTFRLVGKGDDVLVVRINGKIVLDGSVEVFGKYSQWRQSASIARTDKSKPKVLFGFKPHFYAITGDWFNLREGVDTEVEVLISEVPGGDFGAYILIEKEGTPGLKIFSTRPLSDQDKEFLLNSHPDAAKFL